MHSVGQKVNSMRYILGTLIAVRPFSNVQHKVDHCHYRIAVYHDEPLSEGIVEISENDADLVCDRCKDWKANT